MRDLIDNEIKRVSHRATRRKMRHRRKRETVPINYQAFEEYNSRDIGVSRRYALLRYMIDGVVYPGYNPLTVRGGAGTVALNVEGGWGFDRDIRKMIKAGELTIKRKPVRSNIFAGNNLTINYTFAYVTQKGRAVYAEMKKRLKK